MSASSQPRPFLTTTVADVEAAAATPDVVERGFIAEAPGTRPLGDIHYIYTSAGFVYLTTIIDYNSKKVVGWAIEDHMRAALVEGRARQRRPGHGYRVR